MPSSRLSWVRILVNILTLDTWPEVAQQGPPIKAKTKLIPTVRRNVLFPAILEPVIMAMVPCPLKSK